MLLTLLYRWARGLTQPSTYLLQASQKRLTQLAHTSSLATSVIIVSDSPVRPGRCSVQPTLQIGSTFSRAALIRTGVGHVQ